MNENEGPARPETVTSARFPGVRRVVALASLTVGMLAGSAHDVRADTPPSVWDRAKNPHARSTYELHVSSELAMRQLRLQLPTAGLDLSEIAILAARDRILRAPLEIRSDPRIQFDLGGLYARLLDYPRSAEVAKAAIAAFPVHPAVGSAWKTLADACGHIGDHACERQSYLETLRVETEDLHRGIPTLNLAETEMHLGNLRGAIDGYREALRIAGHISERTLAPLAVWGLAVSLDRSGDRIEAERQARLALDLESSTGYPNLLRSSGVFFYPPYEVTWYEGLGAMAKAREETDVQRSVLYWFLAERSFTRYIAGAERVGASAPDPFVALAKARLTAVMAERLKAEKRRGAQRAAPPKADGAVTF